jgi:hypothetical protein
VSSLAVDGPDLFVGNITLHPSRTLKKLGWVTEIDAATGALVRVVQGPQFKFGFVEALAVSGPDLVVANELGGSVDELDSSTGGLVRIISGPPYQFDSITAMAVGGHYMYVGSLGTANGGFIGGVTRVDPSTGALVRVMSGGEYDFNGPAAIAVVAEDVFVTNSDGDSITEFPV